MSLVQANISALYSKLNEFRVNDRYCDVTIRVDEKSFKCHRLILAATCEYFDAMLGSENFKESKAESITLEFIDAAAFAEVLSFAYTGKVTITAENAHSLIVASDFLRLSLVEELCIEYIIKQKIAVPIKNIMNIFRFGRATMRHSLTKIISEYIIANFDTVSKADEFMDLTLEDFRSLLDQYQDRAFSSLNNELLLSTIIRWVHHARRERMLHFSELINTFVCFEKISPSYMKFMVGKLFTDTTTVSKDWIEYTPRNALSLHIYTEWEEDPQTHIFSLVHHDDRDTYECHYSCLLPKLYMTSSRMSCPNGYNLMGENRNRDIRSVPLDNYLYSLNFDYDDHQRSKEILQEFYAASSINLNDTVILLKSPPVISSSFELCSLRNSIYLYNRDIFQPYRASTDGVPDSFTEEELARGFYGYDPATDKWFSVAPLKKMVSNACVTADHNFIYIIGGNDNSTTFQAYDSRTAQWQELPACSGFEDAACCIHEGKIFVSGGLDDPIKTDIFDLVAGKWRSDMPFMNTQRYLHRLVSHKGRVWAIGNKYADSTIEIYDSVVEVWYTVSLLTNAILERDRNNYTEVICYDAVVF